MFKIKCILCSIIFIYCNIFNIYAQSLLIEDYTTKNTIKKIIWKDKTKPFLINLNPEPNLETQAKFKLNFNNKNKYLFKYNNKKFNPNTNILKASKKTPEFEIKLINSEYNFLDTLTISIDSDELEKDILTIPMEIGEVTKTEVAVAKVAKANESARIAAEAADKAAAEAAEAAEAIRDAKIEYENKINDTWKKGILIGSFSTILLGIIPFFFRRKRDSQDLGTDRTKIIENFEKEIMNNISKGNYEDRITGFVQSEYEKKILNNISSGNFEDEISSAAQKALLLRIKEKNYNLNGYSNIVSPLILNTKNGYEELSTDIDKLIKIRESLEEDKAITKARINNLENQIAHLELEVENQKIRAAKTQIYPNYYSDFNEGLSEIYTNLSSLGDDIDHNSPFKEIVDTILTGNNEENQNPVFAFANRDKHVLTALNLKDIKELKNISPDNYFSKYVLWYCSDLINGLSRLSSYANASNYSYNLADKLESEGINLALIKTSYQQLEKLLSSLFNKKIITPKLGQSISNITDYETISYSFIRNNFYTEIQKLPADHVYDFTKPQIINIDNQLSIQKAQVNIKV